MQLRPALFLHSYCLLVLYLLMIVLFDAGMSAFHQLYNKSPTTQ